MACYCCYLAIGWNKRSTIAAYPGKSDLESYLHEDMPSRLNNLQIKDVFGNEELLILVFHAPDVLKKVRCIEYRCIRCVGRSTGV